MHKFHSPGSVRFILKSALAAGQPHSEGSGFFIQNVFLFVYNLRRAFFPGAERIVDELGLVNPQNRGNLRKNMASV